MNIVLINAPYLDIYGALNVGKNFSFPLGIGYIASFLKKHGFNPPPEIPGLSLDFARDGSRDGELVEPKTGDEREFGQRGREPQGLFRPRGSTVYILEPEIYRMSADDVIDYLKDKSADVVGITCATANFKGAALLAKAIKEKLNIFTVLGGVHASSVPEQVISNYPQFDVVVIGEGEFTMLELCRALEKGSSDFSGIKGIMYRDRGKIIQTPVRPYIEDLDSLPFPARELVDLDNYRPQVHLDRGKKSATMITSRGCPAHCTFCASFKTLGFTLRTHSPEYIVSEIEHLVKNYGIEHIIFVDDTFTVRPERVKRVCELIIEKNLKIDWYCFARVVPISRETLELMKKAGCFSLLFGVESSDPQILRNVKKGINPEQVRNAFRLSNELGFKTIGTFIFGLPGDTRQSILKTIDFAMEIKPVIASFNRLIPFPGTEVYDVYYKEKFKDGRHWDYFVPKAALPMVETSGVSAQELQELTNLAYKRFYFRPAQALRILMSIKTWGEFCAYVRGAYGLMRRMFQWKKTVVTYN